MADAQLPAKPKRIPGLPNNFQLLTFDGFDGLNTKPTRAGLKDQQCFVLDNFMPLGKSNLRTLYDVGGAIAHIDSTGQIQPGPVPVPPVAGIASNAVGTTEFDLNAVYAGAADSPFVTISVWLKPSPSPVDGTEVSVAGHTNADFLYGDPMNGTGQYLFPVVNSVSVFEIIPQFNVGNQTTFATAWHNILWSIDTNHGDGLKVVQAYVDDVQQTIQPYTDGHPAFNISFADPAGTSAFLGGLSGIDYTGDIYSIWFAPGVFIDLTVTGNRRKFISGTGQVVDLGANGQLPTGTAPAFYFKGNHTQFPSNLGTGGDVTNSGAALTDAATNPPGT